MKLQRKSTKNEFIEKMREEMGRKYSRQLCLNTFLKLCKKKQKKKYNKEIYDYNY